MAEKRGYIFRLGQPPILIGLDTPGQYIVTGDYLVRTTNKIWWKYTDGLWTSVDEDTVPKEFLIQLLLLPKE